MTTATKLFWFLLILTIIGGSGFLLGNRWYDNPRVEEDFKILRKVLSNVKRELKSRD
jgi:hypothetical protein